MREVLHASHADEAREHEAAIERLQTEHKRLQSRLDAMYIDKLDGRVDATFYERMSTSWREEQIRCLREIERHQAANKSYMDEGVRLLELARNARRLFERQEPREKRRLLNFLVSNCSWKGGELTATLRQPFDFLAETTLAVEKERAVGGIANGPISVGSPGRTRTSDKAVNSRLLYQLSYRGPVRPSGRRTMRDIGDPGDDMQAGRSAAEFHPCSAKPGNQ